jgi:endonuclease/exonuclease/phosphatase family metal-dependent hydrolase
MLFLTYNIWFDERYFQTRIKTLCREVKTYQPDFIAFQEVTEESLKIIKKAFSKYHFIGEDLNFSYDVLLLSKYKPISWDKYLLPNTKMGRSILFGEFEINQQSLTVGTFHLESNFSKFNPKEEQLKFITSLFQTKTVIMGDTNLTKNIDTHYLDVFLQAGEPNEEKYTYSKTNTNVKSNNSRLDRIFYNFETPLKRFQLVGTNPTVITEQSPIHPSDHFGVLVELDI